MEQEEVVVFEGVLKEEILELKSNDSFGDVSILCNIPQPYTVRIRERCLLLRIDKQSFSNILKIYFHDRKKILNNLLKVITTCSILAHTLMIIFSI